MREKTNQQHVKPTSLRLGYLKPHLQMEANKRDRSLHWLLMKIITEHKMVTPFLRDGKKEARIRSAEEVRKDIIKNLKN